MELQQRLAVPQSNYGPQMKIVSLTVQVLVALGLLNVWLLRFSKPTPYRGGKAHSMPEEFAAYGLPSWSLWVVGATKVACAVALLVGVWVPALVVPAAGIINLLMLGAIAMHLKVHDPLRKSVPATLVLALSALVLASTGSW
ncbi:MAG: hypothetical protein RLZZ244_1686 [Verrucomicrobiota bacterium]